MSPAKAKEKQLPPKEKPKTVKDGKVEKTAAKKKVGCRRNYDLGNGVYRFSKTRMFHKKAKYKFIGKKNPKVCFISLILSARTMNSNLFLLENMLTLQF